MQDRDGEMMTDKRLVELLSRRQPGLAQKCLGDERRPHSHERPPFDPDDERAVLQPVGPIDED